MLRDNIAQSSIESTTEGNNWFSSLPGWQKGAIIGGGFAVGGLAMFYLWRKFFSRPAFVPYVRHEEGGILNLLIPSFVENRSRVLESTFDAAQWATMVEQANKEDNYEHYVCLLEDLLLWHLISQNVEQCFKCIESQLAVIQGRVSMKGSSEVNLEAPELIDYLKCLASYVVLSQQANQHQKAAKSLALLEEIDSKILEYAGDDTQKPIKLPRVLYGYIYVATVQYETFKTALQSGGNPDPQAMVHIAKLLTAAQRYSEAHIPSDMTRLSMDEASTLKNMYATLSELFLLQNNFDQAITLSEKLLALTELDSTVMDKALIQRKLGEVYMMRGDLVQAFEEVEKAVGLFMELSETITIPDELPSMGGQNPEVGAQFEFLISVFDSVQLLSGLCQTEALSNAPSFSNYDAKWKSYAAHLRQRWPQLYNRFLDEVRRNASVGGAGGMPFGAGDAGGMPSGAGDAGGMPSGAGGMLSGAGDPFAVLDDDEGDGDTGLNSLD